MKTSPPCLAFLLMLFAVAMLSACEESTGDHTGDDDPPGGLDYFLRDTSNDRLATTDPDEVAEACALAQLEPDAPGVFHYMRFNRIVERAESLVEAYGEYYALGEEGFIERARMQHEDRAGAYARLGPLLEDYNRKGGRLGDRQDYLDFLDKLHEITGGFTSGGAAGGTLVSVEFRGTESYGGVEDMFMFYRATYDMGEGRRERYYVLDISLIRSDGFWYYSGAHVPRE